MAKPAQVPGLGPKTLLREAGPRLLAARLAEVFAREVEVSQGSMPPEAVHDMRVATRRLRATLWMLGLEELGRTLKELQDALGAVRDLHMRQEWFGKVPERELETKGRALAKSIRRFAEEHARKVAVAEPGVKGRLGGHRQRRWLRKLLAKLEPLMEELARLREAAVQPQQAQARAAHLLRIAVKKLRYRAEVLAQARPKAIRALLKEVEPLQELLGTLHDLDVHLALGGDVAREREKAAAAVEDELRRWRKRKLVRALRRRLR
jgi:CHAD domain-containing protein